MSNITQADVESKAKEWIMRFFEPSGIMAEAYHQGLIEDIAREHLEELARVRKDRELLNAILNKLRAMTPIPPKAITWEIGNDILNVVQDELCPAIDAAMEKGGK